MKRLMKILWLPVDQGGCGYHRVHIWDSALGRLGLADSVVLEKTADEESVRKAFEVADVVVARLGAAEYVKVIKEYYPGKVLVFDWDDNTLDTKPSNPAYENFGTRDVWVEVEDLQGTEFYKKATAQERALMDEKGALPLWVTGVTEKFNRYSNITAHTNLLWLLIACDLATSPSPKLTELWSQYAEKAGVVVNCLDFNYYPDLKIGRERGKGEIRVGWSGGSSHNADWKEIMPSLRRMQENYPGMKLVIVGDLFAEYFKGLNVEFHPWVHYEAHPYRMKMLDLDFAIIPLAQDALFNEYKSELKMMEFAALRVPMIIKDQLPYSPFIDRGKNCLAYSTPQEFEKCFGLMVQGKGKDFIEEAYTWVYEKRNVDTLALDLVKLYYSLLPKKLQEEIEVPKLVV